MSYEIEQCLTFEVKPEIELEMLEYQQGVPPRISGSVGPLYADSAAIDERLRIVRRTLVKLLEQGALYRGEPRDIDFGGMFVLKNCTQILHINERQTNIEIRYMQVIG